MADRWFLVNSTGVKYELNPTFSAPQYEAGSIDTDAARRRDDSRTWQRSGDGLRTPGPFTLTGFVWNDPRDPSAAWTELDAIQAAVDFCTRVERRDSRTISIYEDLAGGPTIEILPDGAGGYAVTIRLWPSRAEAVTVPTVTPTTRIRLYIDGSGSMDWPIPVLQSAFGLLRARLDAEVYGGTASSYVDSLVTPSGDAGERWLQFGAALPDDDVIAIVAVNEASPVYHAAPRVPANEPTSTYLADHAAYLSRVQNTLRRRMTLYVVPHETLATREAFAGHVHDAYYGLNGYPQALSTLGMELRPDVPFDATAQWFADDIWSVIF